MPPTGLFYSHPALRARPSADRCRAPRSGRSRSDRASIRSCRARTVGAWRLSQRLCRFQDCERVAVDLQLAPFISEYAPGIEQKSAALDADDFASIQILFADHIEQIADQTISIRQQHERETHLRTELLVRSQAVARDTHDGGAGALEARCQPRKLLALERAARRVIARVEVQHQLAPARVRELPAAAAARRQRKVRYLIADRHGRARRRLACRGLRRRRVARGRLAACWPASRRGALFPCGAHDLTGSRIASRLSESQKSINSSRSCAT